MTIEAMLEARMALMQAAGNIHIPITFDEARTILADRKKQKEEKQ